MKKLLFTLVLMLVAVPAMAVGPKMVGPHTFAWDANPASENVTGYYFYWRVAGGDNAFTDTNRVAVPASSAPTLNALTISAMGPRVNYEVAVTAYNAAGDESEFSIVLPFVISIPTNPANLKKQ